MAVEGIGLGKAEKIAYRGWVYYLHPSATFRSARSGTYQAAVDLYGSGSDEAQRVAQAWDAVGVH
jgi:Zn-dependent metalloprotease